MEKIVGWMKVHSDTGCGFTLAAPDGRKLPVGNIGRGGVTLLRDTGNVMFMVGVEGVSWKDRPQEWADQGYCVRYDYKARGGKQRRVDVTVVTENGIYDAHIPPNVDLHYYCQHSPTPEHVEQLIALAKRHTAAMTEKDYTAKFVVHIVTDQDEVLSVSEELTRAVNEAVNPKLRLTDAYLGLCGGFSVGEIAILSSARGLAGYSVPFYAPKRRQENQPHYPVQRQSKRRIFK